MQHWQSTLANPVPLSGIGVHSGQPASIVLNPAPANSSIVFRIAGSDETILAHISKLADTRLAMAVANKTGAAVSTIEHLMAALSGLRIDNAIIDIEGSEIPILDGSALPLVEAIEQAGIISQNAARRVIEILRPVRIDNGKQWAELLPYDGFKIDIDIDFDHPAIGRQHLVMDVTPQAFRNEISAARTFGFFKDAERLQTAGFGRGASVNNTIIIGAEGIINPGSLRYADEFVRHKALDAVGDLALAGLPLKAFYRSYRGGHQLNAGILKALFIDRSAYRIVELDPTIIRPAQIPVGQRAAAPTYTPSR